MICSSQLLALKIHCNFNRGIINNTICDLLHFYLPIQEIDCTALHFSKFSAKFIKQLVMGTSTLQLSFQLKTPLFSIKWRSALSLGPLHKRDREPVTITFQTLSLVEKVEPIQVGFTLRLRDQHSLWMQDGCKVYMDSYMTSNRLCLMVTWIISKKTPHGGMPNTKPGNRGTPNAYNCWFILF